MTWNRSLGSASAAGSNHGPGGKARVNAFLLTAIIATASGTPARAQVIVDPLEVVLSGARPVALVTVRNESASVQQAILNIGDWDRAETGENRFFQGGTQQGSCGALIKAFPLALRVEPHEIQTVRIALAGPAPPSECWSIVFVEQAVPQAPSGRFGISYALRTGVKVYAIPTVTTRDGEIDSVIVRSDGTMPAKQDLIVGFHNVGSSHETAHGTVEIRRPDNSIAATLDIAEFPTLPGAHRSLVLTLPTLPQGRYVALAVLDFGGSEVAAGELEFESR
ncbi:MAG TPA: hypothetical protein VII66_00735 [Gemmatimonadaceae bacterium]